MKNTEEILQEAYGQIQEDRKKIMDSYGKFYEQADSFDKYAMIGMHLNKCLELLTKQTSQLLDLAKMQQTGDKKKDKGLSEEDQHAIYSSLEDRVQ